MMAGAIGGILAPSEYIEGGSVGGLGPCGLGLLIRAKGTLSRRWCYKLRTYAPARSKSYVIRVRLAQPPLGYDWSYKCILKPDQSKSFVRS
jgi:hypothetical protein